MEYSPTRPGEVSDESLDSSFRLIVLRSEVRNRSLEKKPTQGIRRVYVTKKDYALCEEGWSTVTGSTDEDEALLSFQVIFISSDESVEVRVDQVDSSRSTLCVKSLVAERIQGQKESELQNGLGDVLSRPAPRAFVPESRWT